VKTEKPSEHTRQTGHRLKLHKQTDIIQAGQSRCIYNRRDKLLESNT